MNQISQPEQKKKYLITNKTCYTCQQPKRTSAFLGGGGICTKCILKNNPQAVMSVEIEPSTRPFLHPAPPRNGTYIITQGEPVVTEEDTKSRVPSTQTGDIINEIDHLVQALKVSQAQPPPNLELQQQIQALEQENLRLKNNTAEIQSKLTELERENTSLKEESLKHKESETKTINTLEVENRHLKAEIKDKEALQLRLHDLETRIHESERENQDFNPQLMKPNRNSVIQESRVTQEMSRSQQEMIKSPPKIHLPASKRK
jgi:hypothetical protein